MVEDSAGKEADCQKDRSDNDRTDGKGKGESSEGKGRLKRRPRGYGLGRPPVRRSGGRKTVMCRFYAAGGCSKENCPFAHGEEDFASYAEAEGAPEGAGKGKGERARAYDHEGVAPQRRGEKGRTSRIRPERTGRRPSWKEEETPIQRGGEHRETEARWRDTPLPRNSVSRATMQQLSALIPCRHAMKGCSVLSRREELPAHLDMCAFEKCKEHLLNNQIDPILKFFHKQIAERDKVIEDLRSQCSQSYKEEEDSFGLEEEQLSLFKELVFKTTSAAKIASQFSEKYPTAEWSVFIHHVSESDLSYIYDGYLQWVFKGRRYVLVKLNKPEEEGLLM